MIRQRAAATLALLGACGGGERAAPQGTVPRASASEVPSSTLSVPESTARGSAASPSSIPVASASSKAPEIPCFARPLNVEEPARDPRDYAGALEELGPRLREEARSSTDPKAGALAALRFIDVAARVGKYAAPPREHCWDELVAEIPVYRTRYCGAAPPSTALCATVAVVEFDLARVDVSRLVKAADENSGQEAIRLYRDAGDAYLRLFDEHCRGKKLPPKASARWTVDARQCSEVVYNALRAYTAAQAPDLSARARATLLDPANGLGGTELAKLVASGRRP